MMTQEQERIDKNAQDNNPDNEADIPQYNGVMDFMGQLYNENKSDIHSSIGRTVMMSLKGMTVWFVISFLPIPYRRKRHVHHQITHGQKVDWRYAFFGRFSLLRLVIYVVIVIVVVYFLLQLG